VVLYDANGGTGAPMDNNAYYAGVQVTVLSGVPIRVGYTFVGWLYNGVIYEADDAFVMSASNVVLVAQWTKNVYIVTFAPGVQGAFASQEYADLSYGVNTPSFVGATTGNVGYTFAGWSPSVASTVTANVTYTAQWTQALFTVTYDANGGTGAPASTQHVAGTTVTVSSSEPFRSGFTFKGWLYNSVTYTAGQTFVMPTAAVTLTAQWTENTPSPGSVSTKTPTSTVPPKTLPPVESTNPPVPPSSTPLPPVEEDDGGSSWWTFKNTLIVAAVTIVAVLAILGYVLLMHKRKQTQ
jgi:uncharacterized repeat protein (TIGR02543 family)